MALHLLAVTADHSTPCALMKHSGDPVPIMMVGDGLVRTDAVTANSASRPAAGGPWAASPASWSCRRSSIYWDWRS